MKTAESTGAVFSGISNVRSQDIAAGGVVRRRAVTARGARGRQEGRRERQQAVAGHPVLLVLRTAAPEAAVEQRLRNLQ